MSPRRLYDDGVLLEACPSLAPLAAPATVRANPYDLGRLGVTTAARVMVRSARAAMVFEAVADEGVPRGVACVDFNLHGHSSALELESNDDDDVTERASASALIDARQAVVDVRMETP